MTIGSLDIFPNSANINGLSGYPLTVPHGGTGSTFLAVGVLTGNGSGPIISKTLIQGPGILITNAVNTITITATGATASSFNGNTGTAVPILGVLNIVGSGAIQTDAIGNTVTITSTGGGIAWVDQTTSTTMTSNTGYVADSGSLVTLTLPTTPTVFGSVIRVCGKGTGGWKIAQNAGQTIQYGIKSTTTGPSGSLASSQQYDAVELLCTVGGGSATFTVISSIGNLTTV